MIILWIPKAKMVLSWNAQPDYYKANRIKSILHVLSLWMVALTMGFQSMVFIR